jgi:hypothetical protein
MWFLAAKAAAPPVTHGSALGRGPLARSARRLAKDLVQFARSDRADFRSAGDVLLVVESENQRRVLEPIARELGREITPASARVGWREQRRLTARAVALCRALDAELRAAQAPLPLAEQAWYALARDAAHAFGYARALLATGRWTSAAIGSTHGPVARALAIAAREVGIPSIYVPHAPVLSDAEIVDLPVDYAALRGPGEVEHYASFGVEPQRLAVAGDPSIARAPELPVLRPDGTAVFAPSPDPADCLSQMIAVIKEATSETITVSPHPRSDLRSLRAISPASWTFWPRRTIELLEQGPPVVLQHSSGVALEALQLGIPVVELSCESGDPVYPFIREPHVTKVVTPDELRAALDGARSATASARDALVQWAGHWVARTGAEAAARVAGLLRHARSAGPGETPIWDAWSSPVRSARGPEVGNQRL